MSEWHYDGRGVILNRPAKGKPLAVATVGLPTTDDDGNPVKSYEQALLTRDARGRKMAAANKLAAACAFALGRLENPLLDTSLFEDVKGELRSALEAAGEL